MKIQGQNLSDILLQLPWQYKIVVAASACFILFTAIYVPYVALHFSLGPKKNIIQVVKVAGALKASGMLDPSLTYDARDKEVWMAYTAQENAATMSVRMAEMRGGTNCREWVARAGGFEAKVDDIFAPDGQTVLRSGMWRVETPALVYDPDDKGREWKLYVYKYFWANDPKSVMSVAQHYGVIAYKYRAAASDDSEDWSSEQWLFSAAPGYPPPPYEQSILLHLNRLDPSLQNVVSYARPSVIYKDGALVMTLSAFTDGLTPDRVIMIVSLDHGGSWRYAGTVLQQSDVSAIDANARLAGASLVEQDGQVYLAAVLGNEQQRGQGTFIFGFDDFSKGALQRDPKTGAPVMLHQIPLPKEGTGSLGGGAAAYNDACASGTLVTEQAGNSSDFQIYRLPLKPIDNQQGEK